MTTEFVKYQTKLTKQTRTAVITPFGVTDKFRRASDRVATRGYP